MYKSLVVIIRADRTITAQYNDITTQYNSLADVPIADDVTALSIVADISVRGIHVSDIIPIEDIYMKELYLNGVDVSSLDGIQYSSLRSIHMLNCTNSLDSRMDLTGCPELRLLHILDTDIVRMPDITACTKLHTVTIERSDLSSDALTNLDLSALVRMQIFIIDDCGIQGLLPEYIQYWSNLLVLSLQYNILIGDIPESYSELTKLKRLSLSGNGLEGDISVVTTLNELTKLDVSDTDFDDSQSLAQIVNLPNIDTVSIHDSAITGILPDRTDKRVEVSVDIDSDTYRTANPLVWTVSRTITDEGRVILKNNV